MTGETASRLSISRVVVLFSCLLLAFLAQGLILWGSVHCSFRDIIVRAHAAGRGSPSTSVQAVGLLLSVLAGIIFGLATSQSAFVCSWHRRNLDKLPPERKRRLLREYLPSFVFVTASVALCGISLAWYVKSGEVALVQALWVTSLLLFLLGLICMPSSANAYMPASPFTISSYCVLVGVVTLGFLARFWELRDLPLTISPDVANVGLQALDNLSGRGWKLFSLGFGRNPYLMIVPGSVSMMIFGGDLVGLRLADVILGTSMVLSTYLVVWKATDSHRVAAIAGTMLAINVPHIHFSRHICNIDPWALFEFGCYFLICALRERRNAMLGIAGLCMGLALQLYLSSRLLLIVLPIFAVYLVLYDRRLLWDLKLGVLLFLLAMFVSCGPNLADIVVHTEMWQRSNRLDETILNAQNLQGYALRVGAGSTLDVVFDKLVRCLLLFQFNSDESGQSYFTYPFVDHALAPFMWIGLGICLVHIARNPFCGMIVCMFFLTTFMHAAIANQQNSYWPRMVPAMMLQSVLAALGLSASLLGVRSIVVGLLSTVRLQFEVSRRISRVIEAVLAISLLMLVSRRGWADYEEVSRVDHNLVSLVGRGIAAHTKPGVTVCSVPWDAFRLTAPEVQFLARGRDLRELTGVAESESIRACATDSAVWALIDRQTVLRSLLVQSYPQGQFLEVRNRDGRPIFLLFGTTGEPEDVVGGESRVANPRP